MQTGKLMLPAVLLAFAAAISTSSIAQTPAEGMAVKTSAAAADDSSITSKIKETLAANKETSGLKLQVATNQGVVTLAGTAPSAEAVGNVLKLVASVDGVKDIQNKIQVKAS